MKAYDILDQASKLSCGTAPDELIKKAGVGLINTILSDLNTPPITSLSDEITFSHIGGCTVLTSGVAMLICILLGDDAGLAAMTEIYNSSRHKLLSHISKIRNTAFGGETE